ncbi:putative monoglyceride lipase [Escovopsis weberi]|uniref:Putative monoglyceride lipase n=1 Tax=Escovopsis weberi TaxID=150374 RepID=A0A0M8MZ81_ESCWE|nr:putative monoglyceride lipase [Escovopsis weberi]
MATTEGQFEHDNVSFYTKTWTPEGPTKAKLIFIHGFSDHINRYNDFFPRLAKHGIQVLGWDQRGWGRTAKKPSDKGLTGPTSLVLADMAAFIEDKLPSDAPVFLMGHSMGGGQVLTLAGEARYRPLVGQLRGIVLDSPFIGFTKGEEPNVLKVALGRLAARVFPRQQLVHLIPPEHLSRREDVVASIREDPLCHNTGTLEGLASLLDRTGALQSGAVKLSREVRSVLLAHGTRDLTCSYDRAAEYLAAQTHVEDRTFKSYEGAYHQLHADLCEDEFTVDLVAWIMERCDSGEQVGKIDSKL